MTSLRTIVRKAIQDLDNGHITEAMMVAETLRHALAERGLVAGCHLGNKSMTPEQQVEWYAGQILDCIDTRAWFAMNTIINTCDLYCPAKDGE